MDWGYGCTYVCQDSWGKIHKRIDDFEDWAINVGNSTFVKAKDTLKNLIEDASEMLIDKVERKIMQVNAQHADLEASHQRLAAILDSNSPSFMALSAQDDDDEDAGLSFSAFSFTIFVALSVGIMIENYRVRSQKSVVSDYSEVMDQSAGSSMDQVADIVAKNAKTSSLASSGTMYGTMVLDPTE